jgi:4-amino-4-deoxy-L-arabinose transferase-like glycosyltransferase
MFFFFSKRDYFFSIFLFALYLFLIFFSLKLSPINTRGEAREGQVVQAIERTGKLILPMRNGSIVPSKPPLYHWISYSITKVTGKLSESELRLPSTIAASFLLGVLYLFTKSQSSPILTFMTIAVTATSVEFMRYSTQARVDMVFASSFFLSLIFIYLYLKRIGNKTLVLILTITSLTFTVLAKGPFGLILPGIISTIFIYFDNKKINYKNFLYLLFPFLIAGMLSSVWYFLAYRELGMDFVNMQIKKENISRVINSNSKGIGHGKPFFFSFIYLLQVMLPWSIFLPRIIYSFDRNRFKESLLNNSLHKYFLITLFTFIFAVTVSVSKRSVYYLPIIPIVAYFLSYFLITNLDKKNNKIICLLEKSFLLIFLTFVSIIFFASIIICTLSFLAPSLVDILITLDEAKVILANPLFVISNFILLLFVIKSLLEYFDGRFENFIIKFAISTFIFFLNIQYFIAPIILESYSPKEFSNKVNKYISKGHKIYQLEDEFYPPVFYLSGNAPIVYFDKLAQKVSENSFFIAREKDFPRLDELGYEKLIYETSKNNIASRKEKLMLIKLK